MVLRRGRYLKPSCISCSCVCCGTPRLKGLRSRCFCEWKERISLRYFFVHDFFGFQDSRVKKKSKLQTAKDKYINYAQQSPTLT